jgi:ketosteroid isomerase-like protein
MSADEQKQAAQDGYAAFGKGDADAAMANIADSIQWVVGGDSSVSGTYTGKGEVMGFWGKLLEVGFATNPNEFLADGGKVVVLSTVSVGGESRDVADVLSYDDSGNLTRFQSFGGEDLLNQTFPK